MLTYFLIFLSIIPFLHKKRFYNLFWGAKEKRKLRVLLAPTFLYKKRHIE